MFSCLSLLSFARPAKGESKPVPINGMIEDVLTLMMYEMRSENITVKKDLQLSLPEVSGDRQLLEQVVVDILMNARWAIQSKKEPGTITIETRYEKGRDAVCISISDTGVGMPQENIDRIFEPFFTTKPAGQGTGLGLSVVYNVIKEHKGTIEAKSEVNKGTTFKITLPCSH